jgi:7-carboxy-7-deazaguanine synthase
MPEPATLKISEIFWSVQGEGRRLGEPTVFIRLAGCSLGCDFCDTPQALAGGQERDLDAIVAEVMGWHDRYPASSAVLTGGEPLEQDLTGLVAALKKRNLFVAVETNGLHDPDLALDWWTVAPKPATDYFIAPRLLACASELKLVVTPTLDLQTVARLRGSVPVIPIFLQPDATDSDRYRRTFALLQDCAAHGLAGVYPGVQLHRVYGIA